MQLKQTTVSFQILQNQELIFSPFKFNGKSYTPLHDIDPDIQFYSDKYSLHSCDYYPEGTFNDRILQNNVKDDHFSTLHANIRSALKNLASLEQYINNLDRNFTVIGISGLGLKNTMLTDMVLKVIVVLNTFQPIRSGGGVSIFMQNSIEYFVRTNLSYLNAHTKTIFFEINKEQIGKDKNVNIGVIYRPPITDIKVFNEYVSESLDKIRSQNKCVACLGDYNNVTYLLNSDCHGPTQEFADLMYSYSPFSCITKPTRVN